MANFSKYVVIGGGLAAKEAVKALRKADPEGGILMISEEQHLPYDRPPLTKEFMQGTKSHADIEYDDAASYAEKEISTVLGQAVTKLDAAAHEVTLADGTSLGFEKALLATGGRVIRLPVPGAELDGVHYLRTLDDALAIAAEAGPDKHVAIVGGGFIGLEVAASLVSLGCRATVIEAGPWIWARFADEELATAVQQYCESKGVSFLTNAKVVGFSGDGRVNGVELADGSQVAADFVCVGVGIRPNVELAAEAGLEVENGIVVNEMMQTSHPDIYAAGDVINFYEEFSGRRKRVEHWSHANATGRLAAQAMAGKVVKPYEQLGFVWSDIFDLHLKFVGSHDDHDQTVVRGDLKSEEFAVFYLKAGCLVACFAVNGDPRAFAAVRRLVSGKTDVSEKLAELADPAVDYKSLL